MVCSFVDDPRTTDFYSLQVEGYGKYGLLAVNTFGLDRPDDVEDGCGFRSWGRFNEYNVTDVCLRNGTGAMSLGIELRGHTRTGPMRGKLVDCEYITARFRRTNRGYQEFARSFYTESDDPFQAFQPPTVRYTNVTGGFGFVAAYSQQTVIVYP